MEKVRRRGKGVLLGLALGALACTMGGPGATREAAAGECRPYTAETFPPGAIWWRPAPEHAGALRGRPEEGVQLLVIGVRPDGVLIQNREARSPRLLSWKVLARGRISADGRRTWQPGCEETR